ncbi:MAG: TatD family hydrolase [Bacteroidales bacterium]|jgi:TatD DNase family protein|nr:TatD family hydrolase [Bacteroidales bacterium]
MFLVDTHTHLYLKDYDNDRLETVQRSIEAGIKIMILPNIDAESIEDMLHLSEQFPDNCLPTIGLHPTSVKEDYVSELSIVEKELQLRKYWAIGETGIDLYWDKTFFKEQKICFNRQLEWALEYDLPIIIHARNSLDEIFDILDHFGKKLPKGIFHCFPGNVSEAMKAIEYGFCLGVGGVVTFKNSNLFDVVKHIPLRRIVLETDAPYLAPVPFRGKRNESAYVVRIAEKIAEIKNISLGEVARITTENAKQLFQL